VPKGAKVQDTASFSNQLQTLATDLKSGGLSPSKEIAYKLIQDNLKNLKTNKSFSIEELMEMRKSINDYRFNSGKLSPSAKRNLDQLDDIVNAQLEIYGSKNPKFLKAYRDANTASRGIYGSEKIGSFINSKLKDLNVSPEAAALVMMHNPAVAKGAAATVAARSGLRLVNRLRNPVLRRHYTDVIESALEENASAFAKNMKKFDEAIKKEYPNGFDEEEEEKPKKRRLFKPILG
jgi:hypothetical protein